MRLSDLLPESPSEALRFQIKKRKIGDKVRPIAIPSPSLKKVHERFRKLLVRHFGNIVAAPVSGMLTHREKIHFFQTDLKDAFPSISPERLAGVLCHFFFQAGEYVGSYDEVAEFLKKYCFVPRHGLAQGASTSPILFELYCRWCLDRPLEQLLKPLYDWSRGGIKYTRFVDDLTFSSKHKITRRLREDIKRIIRGAGFRLNRHKTSIHKRGVEKIKILGGSLPPMRQAVLLDEFYAVLERQLDLFFKGELTTVALPALRGRIGWFKSLEVRVEGAERNEKVRRITEKVARAEVALALIREEKAVSRKYQFPREWLDTLRSKVEIVSYVRKALPQYTWAPKARGIKCPCPFCKLRWQTFTVSQSRQSFHCFRCKSHGDVIQFAMRHHRWNFVVAAVQLASGAEVPLPPDYIKRFKAPQLVKPIQMELFAKT
jgi:hypothetical protein